MGKYYPVNLDLKNKKCVVIGAGPVAQRKVRRLLACGARVLVVSPQTAGPLAKLASSGRIRLVPRRVRLADLRGASLVIAASSDRRVHARISTFCNHNNILVNIVDAPDECNFILPSVVSRGHLSIGISTDGLSPALSKKIRSDLEKKFGPEYALFLRLMKKIRPIAIKKIRDARKRRTFFQRVINADIFDLLKRHGARRALARLMLLMKDVAHS